MSKVLKFSGGWVSNIVGGEGLLHGAIVFDLSFDLGNLSFDRVLEFWKRTEKREAKKKKVKEDRREK